jgi:hypothetical protein
MSSQQASAVIASGAKQSKDRDLCWLSCALHKKSNANGTSVANEEASRSLDCFAPLAMTLTTRFDS